VLVVWKLDRLGRSLPHLVETLAALGTREIGFRSLSESIDTGSAGGRLVFHIMAALAEFERALIVERTTAGIKAAKTRGVRVGRRKALTATQVTHARLYQLPIRGTYRELVSAATAAARPNGREAQRRLSGPLMGFHQRELVLLLDGGERAGAVARSLGVSRATLYRALAAA
jgi:DNA invertase Pin-like site-specific DNA recombinase